MVTWRKLLFHTVAFVFLACGSASITKADPITFTWSATGSGSLGATPFVNASFTITSTADTGAVASVSPGILNSPNSIATVFVSGIGGSTFTIPTITVSNQNVDVVGISAPNQSLAILFISNNPGLNDYDLMTAIGPLSGNALFNPGVGFATTAGNFSLTNVSSLTFQAAVGVAPVPEPTTMLLLGTGLVGIAAKIRKRRKAV